MALDLAPDLPLNPPSAAPARALDVEKKAAAEAKEQKDVEVFASSSIVDIS